MLAKSVERDPMGRADLSTAGFLHVQRSVSRSIGPRQRPSGRRMSIADKAARCPVINSAKYLVGNDRKSEPMVSSKQTKPIQQERIKPWSTERIL